MYENLNSPNVNGYGATQGFETVANRLYEKVTRNGILANLKRMFGKRSENELFSLDAVMGQVRLTGQKVLGETTVDLDKIVGTAAEGRQRDFDIDFRPLQQHNKERWLGVAAAWISGRRLESVKLVQVGDVYFVEDGHHRISVARALGQEDIEAVVVQLQGTGALSMPSAVKEPTFTGQPSLRPVAV